MQKGIIWAATIVLVLATAYHASGANSSATTLAGMPKAAPGAPQNVKRITVPAGTRILIRMIDSIDTHGEPGDESASRRCGGGPERHDSLWQARFG
jgi:hypothetical protein